MKRTLVAEDSIHFVADWASQACLVQATILDVDIKLGASLQLAAELVCQADVIVLACGAGDRICDFTRTAARIISDLRFLAQAWELTQDWALSAAKAPGSSDT